MIGGGASGARGCFTRGLCGFGGLSGLLRLRGTARFAGLFAALLPAVAALLSAPLVRLPARLPTRLPALAARLRLRLAAPALWRSGWCSSRGDFNDLALRAVDDLGERQFERERRIGVGADIGVGEGAERGDRCAGLDAVAGRAQLILLRLAERERAFSASQQQEDVAQMGDDLLLEAEEVDRVGLDCAEHGQTAAEVLTQRSGDEFEGARVGAEAERFLGGVERDVVAAGRPELVEQVDRVAQGAGRFAGDQAEGVVADRDRLGVGDGAQASDDVVNGDAAEVVALAAAEDGGFERFGVGGGEDEDDMRGRLFEGLEQGVGGGAGELMDLVDQVDLETGGAGLVVGALAQVADVVDPPVAGGVDFDEVEAERVVAAVEGARAGRDAVDGAGEDACGGGFAGAARTAEEVGVGDFVLPNGVAQGADDGVLSGHAVEIVGAPLAVEDGASHGVKCRRLCAVVVLVGLPDTLRRRSS